VEAPAFSFGREKSRQTMMWVRCQNASTHDRHSCGGVPGIDLHRLLCACQSTPALSINHIRFITY
jgi:hypothetical protein